MKVGNESHSALPHANHMTCFLIGMGAEACLIPRRSRLATPGLFSFLSTWPFTDFA